jgi:hypothetical protein
MICNLIFGFQPKLDVAPAEFRAFETAGNLK